MIYIGNESADKLSADITKIYLGDEIVYERSNISNNNIIIEFDDRITPSLYITLNDRKYDERDLVKTSPNTLEADSNKLLNNQALTSLEKAFYQGDRGDDQWNPTPYPNSITAIKKLNIDTSNVRSMKYMFRGATNLTEITKDIENFDVRNVEVCWSTFEGTRIRSLDLSKWDLIHCNDIGAMFMNCGELEELKFPRFNSDLCTGMSNLFNGCRMLRFIDLSNFVGNFSQSRLQMDYMFKDCSNLEIIDLSGWNLINADRGAPMFEYCNSLKTIACYGCNEETVRKIRQMVNPDVQVLPSKFKYEEIVGKTTCQGYDKYAIEGEMVTEDYGQTWTATGKERVGRLIEKNSKDCGFTGVTETFDLEFEYSGATFDYYINNRQFTTPPSPCKIDIKNNLHIDKITSLSGMFQAYNSIWFGSDSTLTKVTKLPIAPYCNDFHQMFMYCDKLTTINFDNFKTPNGANCIDMFKGCTALKEITVRGCDEDTIRMIEDEIHHAGIHPTIIR